MSIDYTNMNVSNEHHRDNSSLSPSSSNYNLYDIHLSNISEEKVKTHMVSIMRLNSLFLNM